MCHDGLKRRAPVRLPLLAFPLALLLVGASESSPRPTRPLPHRVDLPGLNNFAKVAPGLYRGAQPTTEGFRRLKKMGIRTIVNLRSAHSDRKKLKGLGLNYIHFSFKPWHPEDEDVIPFLKVVTDPAHRPLFVHCQQGVDRTGMMVAVYRVYANGWTVEEALNEMRRFGYHERIWVGLRRYLERFDAEAMRRKVRDAPDPLVETIP